MNKATQEQIVDTAASLIGLFTKPLKGIATSLRELNTNLAKIAYALEELTRK